MRRASLGQPLTSSVALLRTWGRLEHPGGHAVEPRAAWRYGMISPIACSPAGLLARSCHFSGGGNPIASPASVA